jgi:energy-coupling factor transporter ATP-binding protein EcfA2
LLNLNRVYGTTLLLVTHDHHLADKADRKISLSGGRIAEDRLKRDGATGRRGDGETQRQAERGAEDELRPRAVAPSPRRPVTVSGRDDL